MSHELVLNGESKLINLFRWSTAKYPEISVDLEYIPNPKYIPSPKYFPNLEYLVQREYQDITSFILHKEYQTIQLQENMELYKLNPMLYKKEYFFPNSAWSCPLPYHLPIPYLTTPTPLLPSCPTPTQTPSPPTRIEATTTRELLFPTRPP